MSEDTPPGSREKRPRRMDRALQAEKLQLRLLMMEEKYRGHVMRQQVDAFEEKVYLSFKNLNIDLLVNMIQTLRGRSKPPKDIQSLKDLHKAVVQEASRNAASRKRETPNRKARPIEDDDGCVNYFMWFFEYLDYLRDLKVNFTERIFQPLFKYFHEGSSLTDDKRRGSASIFSFTHFSLDSSDSGEKSENDDSGDSVTTARQRAQAKQALMLLSNEFTDIKALYDTSEVDNVAKRLSLTKEHLDFLLDNEDSIVADIYSPDSERVINADLDETTENLVRFVPDVLVKFRKCGWLARRWLQLDSVRTKDLNMKLEKIVELEKKLNSRMTELDEDILRREAELEKDLEELQKLLLREERSNDLSLTIYDLDDRISKLQTKLEFMRKDRDQLTSKVLESIKNRNKRQYDELKVKYESNKLHRYIIGRQLATLNFHRDIVEQDMRVELSIKPSIIHSTNSLQDQCERLEEVINKEKNQKHTIKTALVPIGEDRKVISERLLKKRMSEPRPDFTMAQYLGSTKRCNSSREAMILESHKQFANVATHLRSYPRPSTPDW